MQGAVAGEAVRLRTNFSSCAGCRSAFAWELMGHHKPVEQVGRDYQVLRWEMEERYSRQIVIPEIGREGQARLRKARVLVVGCGGLGSPALLYLAAAGVGTLGVADSDQVSLSNLNRQILYETEDLGRSKVLAAVRRLRALNPDVRAIPYEERVLLENGSVLVRNFDLVVEASDNLETKDLLNTLCVTAQIPLVWGAVQRFEGQLGTVLPGYACRRCVFPVLPQAGTYPMAADLGVIGATAGVIGSLQAMEAIKILLGLGRPLVNRLLLWEGLTQSFDIVEFAPNPTCVTCGSPTVPKP